MFTSASGDFKLTIYAANDPKHRALPDGSRRAEISFTKKAEANLKNLKVDGLAVKCKGWHNPDLYDAAEGQADGGAGSPSVIH